MNHGLQDRWSAPSAGRWGFRTSSFRSNAYYRGQRRCTGSIAGRVMQGRIFHPLPRLEPAEASSGIVCAPAPFSPFGFSAEILRDLASVSLATFPRNPVSKKLICGAPPSHVGIRYLAGHYSTLACPFKTVQRVHPKRDRGGKEEEMWLLLVLRLTIWGRWKYNQAGFPGSSNGRTTAFGAVDPGSSPGPGARLVLQVWGRVFFGVLCLLCIVSELRPIE